MAWDHFCPSGFAKKLCEESRITVQVVKKGRTEMISVRVKQTNKKES